MKGCNNFEELWPHVANLPLSQNDFRVFIELCISGKMNQKMLCEKRGWKSPSISRSVRRLQEIGVIRGVVIRNQIFYCINEEFKNEKKQKEDNEC